MPLGLLELKKNYNKTLAREKKAENFINKATDKEFEKWLPEFNKIIVELSMMIKQYKDLTGQEMSKTEVSEGFEI